MKKAVVFLSAFGVMLASLFMGSACWVWINQPKAPKSI